MAMNICVAELVAHLCELPSQGASLSSESTGLDLSHVRTTQEACATDSNDTRTTQEERVFNSSDTKTTQEECAIDPSDTRTSKEERIVLSDHVITLEECDVPFSDTSTTEEVTLAKLTSGHPGNHRDFKSESVRHTSNKTGHSDHRQSFIEQTKASADTGDGNPLPTKPQFPIALPNCGIQSEGHTKKPVAVVSPMVADPRTSNPKRPLEGTPKQLRVKAKEFSHPRNQASSLLWVSTTTSGEILPGESPEVTPIQRKEVTAVMGGAEHVSNDAKNKEQTMKIWQEACGLMAGSGSVENRKDHQMSLPDVQMEDRFSSVLRGLMTKVSADVMSGSRYHGDLAYLQRSNFFYDHLSRSNTKAKLRDTSIGTFLIRNSSDRQFEYTLSIKTPSGVTSVRFARNPSGLIRLDCDAKMADRMPAFRSVLDLVVSYVRDESGERSHHSQCIYLEGVGMPEVVFDLKKAFEEVPATLAHLCRRRINSLVAESQRHELVRRLACLNATHKRVIMQFLEEYPFRI